MTLYYEQSLWDQYQEKMLQIQVKRLHCFPKPSYDHTYEKDSTEKHLKHINYSAASVNKNMRAQIDKESYKYELCDYPNREIISVMPQMKYR